VIVHVYTAESDPVPRYENNDYRGFKRQQHEALHPGDDAPPLAKPSKWFPEDRTNQSGSAEQEEDESEEEDVYISGVKQDYKDPLSLQQIRHPYTSKVCKHTYEKKNIVAYITEQGTHFAQSQARGPRSADKQVKCVYLGCEKVCRRKPQFWLG
jgi:hypothetical protein